MQGFCDGLISSRIFVPLFSRGAINHPTNPRQQFPALTPTSPCDNVLLEHRLALDLVESGMIDKIYPILIGDDDNGMYKNYFASGCCPNLASVADVVVASVEDKLHHHLEGAGLGSPMLPPMTVKKVFDAITINQGKLVQGPKDRLFVDAVSQIKTMLAEVRHGW
jgi:hypothetical protein